MRSFDEEDRVRGERDLDRLAILAAEVKAVDDKERGESVFEREPTRFKRPREDSEREERVLLRLLCMKTRPEALRVNGERGVGRRTGVGVGIVSTRIVVVMPFSV